MARVRIPLSRTKASQMPPACIICGGAVDAHVAKLFTWRPPFLSVGFYVSLFVCLPLALIIVVVGFANTRRVLVECPVCERHRGYWAWRSFWTFAPLLVITIADLTLGIMITLGIHGAARWLPDGAFAFLFFGTAAGLFLWAAFLAVL